MYKDYSKSKVGRFLRHGVVPVKGGLEVMCTVSNGDIANDLE